MEVLLVALATRITHWAVGGRRYHPLVSFYTLRCAATAGRSASAVCNLVAMYLKTPVRPVWYCGTVLDGVVRLVLDHRRNQTRARLSVQRESGAAVTRGDLTATTWIKSKTLSQSSAMVDKVLAVSCLFFPVLFFLLSSSSSPHSL